MPATLTKAGDTFEVDLSTCRGTEFQDTLERIQTMRETVTARFDWDRKLWIFQADPDVGERLVKGVGCRVNSELLEWLRDAHSQRTVELSTVLPEDVNGLLVPWAYKRAPWQPTKVNGTVVKGLVNYQRVAVDHLVRHRRVLLGDEMGLGKTLIALSVVEEYKIRNGIEAGPVLIISPSSVKGSWLREIKRWLPADTEVVVVDGSTPKKRHEQLKDGIERNAYVVCNWEQIRVKKEQITREVKRKDGTVYPRTDTVKVPKESLFAETEWLAVIADEVHRAKNKDSQQSQGLRLLQNTQLKLGLTGTAVQNAPDELWAILAWLYPEDYHENGRRHNPNAIAYWPFYNLYCDFYEVHNRKVITGVKNADQLRFRLKDRMIRRTAKVLGLKGRKRFYYPVTLGPYQRGLYDEATQNMWVEVEAAAQSGDKSAQAFIDKLMSGGNVYTLPNGAARMVRQRQLLESPALLGGTDESAVLDDLVEHILDSSPDQWVVFTAFKETPELIAERLAKHKLGVGIYTGDVLPADRTELEDKFQAGNIEVMAGTIDAMREGITLTAAHEMYFVSRAFVPAWNEQAEAREDRMGQSERVNVWIPQAENTIADGSLQVINKRKEKIVRNIQPMDEIPEERAA